ncbi:MAG: C39 family peptidase [Armatimonadetes bacterium]|nr:C39 family peptidase [Armatimonadota bacterium]
MIVGYYDNSGFPNMCRQKTGRNPDVYTDYLFPTGGYPNDNARFLLSTDDRYLYPSRCDVSATQAGVFGRDVNDKGHVDDYVIDYGPPASAQDNFYTRVIPNNGILHWEPHHDDCIADFMGTSIRWYRNCTDGNSWIRFVGTDLTTGALSTWVPPSYNSTSGYSNYPFSDPPANCSIDVIYGLARYIALHAGYYCTTNHAQNNDPFDDIAQYYNQAIKGYQSTTNGVTEEDVIASINAGRPMIALLNQVNPSNNYYEMTSQHAFPIFGYKQEEGQPLKLLAYDTWREDYLNYEATSYRVVEFLTPTQAHYHSGYYSFVRASQSTYWKLFGFAFLKINNNDRCPLPLGTNDYPSAVYQNPFDINFDLPAGNSRIHYSGLTPTPASSAVTLDANGDGTLHIDQDCVLNFRTYRDATPPNGYLASDVVRRVYSVFSANKNIKKFADDTEVTMVNGIVTHVLDSNNFYFEERDKRLFGIRVHKSNHGLSAGDEVEVVVGNIDTDSSNDERYIEATSVTETAPATKVITPYCMTNICLGGKDYLPAGGSGTGYGQKGVVNSNSLNNIGVLVRTVGKVTYIDTNAAYFTISDGSGAVDSGDHDGVKISASGLIPQGLAVDDFVIATGICSLEKDNNNLYPVLIARDSDDLIVVN